MTRNAHGGHHFRLSAENILSEMNDFQEIALRRETGGEEWVNECLKGAGHSRTHPAHPLTRSPAHPLTRSPAHPLTRRTRKCLCLRVKLVFRTGVRNAVSGRCIPWNSFPWFACFAYVACLLSFWRASRGGCRELHLLCWTEYVPQKVIEGFSKQAKAGVIVENYNSNAQMLAALRAKPGYYDLIQPSGFYAETLEENGGLEALDLGRVPNVATSDPAVAGAREGCRKGDSACHGWPARWELS